MLFSYACSSVGGIIFLKEELAARQDFSQAIAMLEPLQTTEDEAYRPWVRLLVQASYLSRAVVNEAAANRKLPLVTTYLPSSMPDVQVVAAGTAEFAQAFLDIDQALRQRELALSHDLTMAGAGVDRSLSLARHNRNLILARTRFYLVKGLYQRNRLAEALAIVDMLDRSPSLLAGEAHYDVACVYAAGYGHWQDQDRYAQAAVRHLRKALEYGFGKDPIQKAMGTIKVPFAQQVALDADFNSLRKHPAFVAFMRELNQQAPAVQK